MEFSINNEAGHEIGYADFGPNEGYQAPHENRTIEIALRLGPADEPAYYMIDVN